MLGLSTVRCCLLTDACPLMFAALLPQCLSSETAWSCWKQAGTAVHILLHARGVGILWTQILGHHLHQAALLLLTRMCAFLKSSIKRLLALLGSQGHPPPAPASRRLSSCLRSMVRCPWASQPAVVCQQHSHDSESRLCSPGFPLALWLWSTSAMARLCSGPMALVSQLRQAIAAWAMP
jgi:hypothetical protein